MSWQILHGRCIEHMVAMTAGSVDAVVTDPPYFLAFMGRAWDTASAGEMQARHELWAREALRVLKPGGHLLAFGGTRTYHRLTCAIEDAGFEVRDCIAWMYGSGFPKSLDVGKAIDKAAGASVVVHKRFNTAGDVGEGNARNGYDAFTSHVPQTPDAVRWDGWGTALKPAFEPIVVARKPLTGTVAGNVMAHGTGALNVDGCRIGNELITAHGGGQNEGGRTYGMGSGIPALEAGANPHNGRWPANVILDEEAAAVLDEQTGELTSNSGTAFTRNADGNGRAAFGTFEGNEAPGFYGDTGGASRFFYVAKADSAERNAGLGDSGATLFTPHACACEPSTADAPSSTAGIICASCGGVIGGARRNDHPT